MAWLFRAPPLCLPFERAVLQTLLCGSCWSRGAGAPAPNQRVCARCPSGAQSQATTAKRRTTTTTTTTKTLPPPQAGCMGDNAMSVVAAGPLGQLRICCRTNVLPCAPRTPRLPPGRPVLPVRAVLQPARRPVQFRRGFVQALALMKVVALEGCGVNNSKNSNNNKHFPTPQAGCMATMP